MTTYIWSRLIIQQSKQVFGKVVWYEIVIYKWMTSLPKFWIKNVQWINICIVLHVVHIIAHANLGCLVFVVHFFHKIGIHFEINIAIICQLLCPCTCYVPATN